MNLSSRLAINWIKFSQFSTVQTPYLSDRCSRTLEADDTFFSPSIDEENDEKIQTKQMKLTIMRQISLIKTIERFLMMKNENWR